MAQLTGPVLTKFLISKKLKQEHPLLAEDCRKMYLGLQVYKNFVWYFAPF
jgi:hypothetical protein